ncbi:hypothetical protein [Halobacteriovorax sp.]|uniref:hypothetical protein n=1 Tax=Halobacteriovorax sp. TaxID=2020862 RepID=UPI003AF288F0
MKLLIATVLIVTSISHSAMAADKVSAKKSFIEYIMEIIIKPSIPHDGEGDSKK